MDNREILLIGCGQMSIEYCKVLKNMSKKFVILGRGKNSAIKFEETTKIKVYREGLEKYLKNHPTPNYAIVVVGINQLPEISLKLIKAGIKNILIEKPGAININCLIKINILAQKAKSKIWIAYNRRFNSSTIKLKELVSKDGGISSLFFEFTELSHKIENLSTPINIKNKWLIANSSHVIDLAFHLIGMPNPNIFHVSQKGEIVWHPSSSIFVGCGESINNIPFSYHADWNCPGRWGITVMTKENTYILKPLEKLKIISKHNFDAKEYKLDDNIDRNFKPGLYLQCKSFLEGPKTDLCTLKEQIEAFKFYYLMAGYNHDD